MRSLPFPSPRSTHPRTAVGDEIKNFFLFLESAVELFVDPASDVLCVRRSRLVSSATGKLISFIYLSFIFVVQIACVNVHIPKLRTYENAQRHEFSLFFIRGPLLIPLVT